MKISHTTVAETLKFVTEDDTEILHLAPIQFNKVNQPLKYISSMSDLN